MTKVKICGITELKHALAAADAGADYIGFVFAKSKRQITREAAKVIISQLPDKIQTIGVFVDEPLERMIEIADYCGLDLLQLHGKETYESYQHAGYPIIKSVSVKGTDDLTLMDLPEADYLLFDTWHEEMAGGSGEVFDWKALKDKVCHRPFFLAGGLNEDNVEKGIALIRPYAVDVSSGVEKDGKKDLDKIKQFIKKVKGCHDEL
ncbi:MAG: phosphoribosylanthranilate isomerase [Clostridia bacterium]|nr:phosphoribosylanthranilate isomerase [Clostridia bacterium]